MDKLNSIIDGANTTQTTASAESQTSLIGQAAINNGKEIQQNMTYKIQNMSNTYHIDKIDIGYSGSDFEGLLKSAFDTVTNGIVVNGNRVIFGR